MAKLLPNRRRGKQTRPQETSPQDNTASLEYWRQSQLWWQAQSAWCHTQAVWCETQWWQAAQAQLTDTGSSRWHSHVHYATTTDLHAKAKEASHTMEGVTQLEKVKELIEKIAAAALVEHIAQPATNALAADALRQISELMLTDTGSQIPEIKSMRMMATDILVLACARHVNPDALKEVGMPTGLKDSLSFAMGFEITQDKHLYARLGMSKYNVFTRGVKFYSRPAKPRGKAAAAISPNPGA